MNNLELRNQLENATEDFEKLKQKKPYLIFIKRQKKAKKLEISFLEIYKQGRNNEWSVSRLTWQVYHRSEFALRSKQIATCLLAALNFL